MSDRIGLKVISILLGIFAWAYVNLVIPPVVRRTMQIKVEYRNMPELMKVTPGNPIVEVEIEGSRRDFIISGSEKAQASVDLYNLRPGKAILPVKVITAAGLNVKSVTPPQIQVDAIALVRKEFPVTADIQGQPAEGFLAEEPRISPDKVTLEGPEGLIKRVKSCQVEVILDQVKNSISENTRVKVFLDVGQNNGDIKVIPEKVSVDVTVKQGYPRKIVNLSKPVFINKPPEGKKLEGYTLVPEKVMITGPARLLDQMSELGYSPIDLAKIHESASLSLRLEFPGEKVKLVGSTPAYIEVKLADTKVVRVEQGLDFEVKKADNQHTSVSVSSYSLEVEGYIKDLEKIRNARLQMILDIQKMSPGTYDVPLNVPSGLPKDVKVLRIIPETVKIDITQLPEVDSSEKKPGKVDDQGGEPPLASSTSGN
ncbi:MAG: YbbR-like domain-containing protein [Candidatus Rifleibacteriota bacterium]